MERGVGVPRSHLGGGDVGACAGGSRVLVEGPF